MQIIQKKSSKTLSILKSFQGSETLFYKLFVFYIVNSNITIAYFMADCGDSPCILCSFYITFKRTVFQGIFPPRGNCAHSVTGATCHGGRRK